MSWICICKSELVLESTETPLCYSFSLHAPKGTPLTWTIAPSKCKLNELQYLSLQKVYHYSLYQTEGFVCLFTTHQFVPAEYILTFKYLHTQLYSSCRRLWFFKVCVLLLTWLSVGSSTGQKIQVKNAAEEKWQTQRKLQHWAAIVPSQEPVNADKQSSGWVTGGWQTVYAISHQLLCHPRGTHSPKTSLAGRVPALWPLLPTDLADSSSPTVPKPQALPLASSSVWPASAQPLLLKHDGSMRWVVTETVTLQRIASTAQGRLAPLNHSHNILVIQRHQRMNESTDTLRKSSQYTRAVAVEIRSCPIQRYIWIKGEIKGFSLKGLNLLIQHQYLRHFVNNLTAAMISMYCWMVLEL